MCVYLYCLCMCICACVHACVCICVYVVSSIAVCMCSDLVWPLFMCAKPTSNMLAIFWAFIMWACMCEGICVLYAFLVYMCMWTLVCVYYCVTTFLLLQNVLILSDLLYMSSYNAYGHFKMYDRASPSLLYMYELCSSWLAHLSFSDNYMVDDLQLQLCFWQELNNFVHITLILTLKMALVILIGKIFIVHKYKVSKNLWSCTGPKVAFPLTGHK